MNSAVIVAAGQGTRMGPGIDKLFLDLAGKPVVAHTWQRFEDTPAIAQIVLVVRAGMQSAFLELAKLAGFRKPFQLVEGGRERQDSVWNGLEALSSETEIVAIQDGARPCTSLALITASIQAAIRDGAAVAAQRVTDTLKEANDNLVIEKHLDRSRLWSVQTPQTFRLEVIRRAILTAKERGLSFTDDTAACGLIGQKVSLVESLDPNPKVTTRADLPYVEWLLAQGDSLGDSRTMTAPRP